MHEAVVWRRFSGHGRKTYQADKCTAVHTKAACDDGKENEILLKKYRFLISYCRKGTFPSILRFSEKSMQREVQRNKRRRRQRRISED